MRQLGRAVIRLFEAYAGVGDAAWFVHHNRHGGCDAVVQRPTLIPPLDAVTTNSPRTSRLPHSSNRPC